MISKKFIAGLLIGAAVALIAARALNLNFSAAPDIKSISSQGGIKTLDWLTPAPNCPSEIFPENVVSINADYESCEQHLSKCTKHCRKGESERCFSAALTHQLLENDDQGLGLFAEACRQGVIVGCTNLAASLRARELGDAQCIANTFLLGCDKNDEWACAMSSVVVWNGEGVEKDAKRAQEFADKTCSLSATHDACQLASEIKAEITESGAQSE